LSDENSIKTASFYENSWCVLKRQTAILEW